MRRTQYTNEIKGEKVPKAMPCSAPPMQLLPTEINSLELVRKELNKASEECFPDLNGFMNHQRENVDRTNRMIEEHCSGDRIPVQHIYSPGRGPLTLLKPCSDKLTTAYNLHREAVERSSLSESNPSSPPSPEAVNILWDNWMFVEELLFVQVTKFAKLIPGFNDLHIDDRILLLKASHFEVLTFIG